MEGPGTFMSSYLKKLGLEPTKNCNCMELADVMDDFGYEKTMAHKDAIIEKMRKNAIEYGWHHYLIAGYHLFKEGVVVNPRNPIPGLFAHIMKLYSEQVHEMELRNNDGSTEDPRWNVSEDDGLFGESGL